MNNILLPPDYDYLGVYLTQTCHLSCPYCITAHHGAAYRTHRLSHLSADQWIAGLNRLQLPPDVPMTLQGGEPFLHRGIWQILENLRHKIDILTALPPLVEPQRFEKLKTLQWNKRPSPYPTIRVSYHRGQHDFEDLIDRVAELQQMLSIGVFYLDHPDYPQQELQQMRAYARKRGVELRSKEFLGWWNGSLYGTFLYKDAVAGRKLGFDVLCRNAVVPIAPDGTIYRCHSDLYFSRAALALGNILDEDFEFPTEHLPCQNYGLCSECDVKIKTNRYQIYGYTSADIQFLDKGSPHELQKAEDTHH